MGKEKLKKDIVAEMKIKEELARAFEVEEDKDKYLVGRHEEIRAHLPAKLAEELKSDIELNYELTSLSIVNRVPITPSVKKFLLEKGWSMPDIKIIIGFENIQKI